VTTHDHEAAARLARVDQLRAKAEETLAESVAAYREFAETGGQDEAFVTAVAETIDLLDPKKACCYPDFQEKVARFGEVLACALARLAKQGSSS
jgi:putative intracellular protease/amidase